MELYGDTQVCLSGKAGVPGPSHDLLAVHYACARIANASGMVEVIDSWHDDIRQIDGLAAEGDGDLLAKAIWSTGLASRLYNA